MIAENIGDLDGDICDGILGNLWRVNACLGPPSSVIRRFPLEVRGVVSRFEGEETSNDSKGKICDIIPMVRRKVENCIGEVRYFVILQIQSVIGTFEGEETSNVSKGKICDILPMIRRKVGNCIGKVKYSVILQIETKNLRYYTYIMKKNRELYR